MSYPTITNPREQDHVIMDILFLHDLDSSIIKRLNRCRGAMKAIFLSDIVMVDGKYLEHFVFDPLKVYIFLRETYQGQLGDMDRFLA